jgi:hypothetical protein
VSPSDWRLPSPDEIAAFPLDQLPALVAQLSATLGLVAARLALVERPPPIDEPLQAADAAGRLGVTEDYLRRYPDRFPGCVMHVAEGTVRYSAQGIEVLKKRLRTRDLSSGLDTALLRPPRTPARGKGAI